MNFLTKLYLYIRYYRHEQYVSSEWLHEFDMGWKDDLIVH